MLPPIDTIKDKVANIKKTHPANRMAKYFDIEYLKSLPKDK